MYHLSPASGRPNICKATKRGCPLGDDANHFFTKDDARKFYEVQQKENEIPQTLNKNSTKAPPVMTPSEIEQEENEMEDQLYGYSIEELMRSRSIGRREVLEAEESGDFYIDTKVPSYYEVSFSTDLARARLNMPPRQKGYADNTELRKAYLEMRDADDKIYGKMLSSEENIRLSAEQKKAREKFNSIKEENSIQDFVKTSKVTPMEGNRGPYLSVNNKNGRQAGTIEYVDGKFSLGTYTKMNRETYQYEWESKGTAETQDEAMQKIATETKHIR